MAAILSEPQCIKVTSHNVAAISASGNMAKEATVAFIYVYAFGYQFTCCSRSHVFYQRYSTRMSEAYRHNWTRGPLVLGRVCSVLGHDLALWRIVFPKDILHVYWNKITNLIQNDPISKITKEMPHMIKFLFRQKYNDGSVRVLVRIIDIQMWMRMKANWFELLKEWMQ